MAGDRMTDTPGGCECMYCGCIFIGAEWHELCAECFEQGKVIGMWIADKLDKLDEPKAPDHEH